MGDLDDSIRDFADEYTEPAAANTFTTGTVTNVAANASSDGRALITVALDSGSSTTAACNYDYTPGNGHRVLVLLMQDYPIIVCRLGSFPPV